VAAKDFSFDIVSRVDMQEFKNAVDQAKRELANRFDLKATKCEIQFEKENLTLVADDEFRLKQLKDIVESKLVKRGLDLRNFEYGKLEPGTKLTVHQDVKVKQGLSQDIGRTIVKAIKDRGLKVQAQIQGEELRVSGRDKDELQKAIALVKGLDLPVPVQFVNYR